MRWDSVQYVGDPDDDDARYDWVAKRQRKYTKQELMFDWDPFNGVLETYDYDGDTGTMHFKRVQDCTTVIDDNKEWQASEQNWRKKDDKWIRFASIPMIVVEQWMKEGINVLLAETDRKGVPNEHMRRVLLKLRDPDWKFLKTVDMDMGDGRHWGNFALGMPSGGNATPYMPTLPEDLAPPVQTRPHKRLIIPGVTPE